MKRLILAVFVALMALPAHAGWNLRQNGDGTTEWVREDSDNVQRAIPVGAHYLTVEITDASSAGTAWVPVPVTDVRIESIRSVLHGVIATADAVFRINTYTSSTLIGQVTNGTGNMTITQSGSAAGDVDTFTPTATNANGYVGAGDAIAIYSVGGSTQRQKVTFVITLVPR